MSLKSCTLAFLTVTLMNISSHSHPLPPPGGHVGVHGMLVFGRNYFSHIPMFHKPHDYQILMDVELHHPDLPPDRNFGDELHTFVPEKFSLGDLLNGKLEQVEGTLYRGNFEKDGQPLLQNVQAEIKQVLHSKHLSEDGAAPAELEYILYGSKEDAYLIHPIGGGAAGFDQLLSVEAATVQATDQELAKGLWVRVPGRANSIEARLVPGSGEIPAVEQGDGDRLELKVKEELSVLVGPHFTDGP